MDETKPVKLKISGKLTFEDNITLAQAAQIVVFLGTPGDPSMHQGNRPLGRTSQAASATSASPREALETSGAKTNPEKIVALGLHVLQQDAKETFTLDDIRPLFRRAREPTPRNISRDLDGALKSGWIGESETKGEFYVMDKAMRVLQSGFADLRSTRSRLSSSRSSKPARKRAAGTAKKRRSSVTTPEGFQNIDHVSPKIAGLPDYHKLKTKTDKFLWAVYAAKELGIASVTNQDLVWLTDALGDGIPAGQIAGYFRQNQQKGYVNRSMQTGKIRITPPGEEYLKSKTED